MSLLAQLQYLINQLILQQAACCNQIFIDFQQTWTIIANLITPTAIVDLSGVFTALNACCNNINSEFQQTWTILANLNTTATVDLSPVFTALNACCNNITSEFQQTWTIIANLNTTATVDLSPVFTALNACCNNINSEFQQTWTILAAGFNGTFSEINSCCTNITSEFQQTWTILANLAITATADLSGVFTALNACCNNINSEFQQTWTILAAGFNGTFSSIATLTNDFEATWTILAAGFNGTWTILNADFDATWTILAADFDGTFSMLNVLIQNDCNPTMITQASFGASGGTQYVISTPGVYKFGSNIIFTPASATSAILIATSGVTLDLQCFTISQGNVVTGVNAILVDTGLTGVYIRNGMIENFTRAGISFQGDNTNVGIDNTNIVSCATRGIELLSTGVSSQDMTIANCNIYNCSQGSSADFPVELQLCQECNILNCNFTGNGNQSNTITVLNMSGCLDCEVTNITMYENIGSIFNGITLDTTCSYNNFTNCIIINNQSVLSTGTCSAININGANGNAFNYCVANNNHALNNGTINAIWLQGIAPNNNTFSLCIAAFNTGGISYGFYLSSGSYNNLLYCQANENVGSVTSAGFNCNATDTLFDNGIALANAANQTFGFNISAGSCVIKDCLAAFNVGPHGSNGFGFNNTSAEYLFYRNVAYENNTQFNGIAAGAITVPIGSPASQNLNTVTGPWTNVSVAS